MIEHHRHTSLQKYNSFGVDALADEIVCYDTPGELCRILSHDVAGRPWTVLAGGNNILFTQDYHGVLLHPTAPGIALTADDGRTATVRAEAGAEWDDVVAWCAQRGLWGVENLSLIPGYAGAAPVQNIGAYGAEVKDVVHSVEVVMTDTLTRAVLRAGECRFGYRDSIFKHELKGRAVITALNMTLSRQAAPRLGYGQLEAEVSRRGEPTLQNIREAVIHIRRSKLPDPAVMGNAGSFFKNPVVDRALALRLKEEHPAMPFYPAAGATAKLAAGWLIEQSGWKGRTLGAAGVHPDQALVLVNTGGATGRDILALATRIREDVWSRFGVGLDMEVNVL